MPNFKTRFLIEREHEKMCPGSMVETDASSSEGSFDGYNRLCTPSGESTQEKPQQRMRLCRKLIEEEESSEPEPDRKFEFRNFLAYSNKYELSKKDPRKKKMKRRQRKKTDFFKPGNQGAPCNHRTLRHKKDPPIDNIIASIDRFFVSCGGVMIDSEDVITRLEKEYDTKLGDDAIHFIQDHLKNLVLGKVRPIRNQQKIKIEDLDTEADKYSLICHQKTTFSNKSKSKHCKMRKKDQESGEGSNKKRKRIDQMHSSTVRNSSFRCDDKVKLTKRAKERRCHRSEDSNENQKHRVTTLKEKTEEKQTEERKSCSSGESVNFYNGYQWMGRLDNTADLVYRAAHAKLQIIGAKEAISFFHEVFREVYANVDEAMLNLFRNDFKCQRSGLLNLRNKVVGLWCGYVRLVMEIADMVSSQEKRVLKSLPSEFSQLSSSQVLELQNALFDFALMVLSQANRCSLAGNHAFVALSHSKIALFRDQCFPENGRTASESFRLGFGMQKSEAYFDYIAIDVLAGFGIVERSAVISLFCRANNRILRGGFLFKDKMSEKLLQQESGMVNRQADIEDDRISSILSCFPALEKDRNLELEVLRPQEQDLKQAGNGLYCFDVEIIKQNKKISIPKATPAMCFGPVKHQEVIKKESHATNIKNLDNNCNDVEFYCQWCKLNRVFKSENDLSSHMQCCPAKQNTTPEVQAVFKFGDAKLCSNLRITSFDPEVNPFFSNDQLLDVLDYSVEFFETAKVNMCSTSSDKLLTPRFVGQVGLRCRHCAEKEETAVGAIFPRSIDDIPKCFWLLSLTHLDKCPKQPRFAREKHQAFRSRFCLTGCAITNYWKGGVLESGIVESNRGSGLIVRGNY